VIVESADALAKAGNVANSEIALAVTASNLLRLNIWLLSWRCTIESGH
jgi:hypothetical protein